MSVHSSKIVPIAGVFLMSMLTVACDSSEVTEDADLDAAIAATDAARADLDYYDHLNDKYQATDQAEQSAWQYEESETNLKRRAREDGENAAEDPYLASDPGSYDCEDFYYEGEAQEFFLASGGPEIDLFLLDDDRDGDACEWLPDTLREADQIIREER